MGDKRKILFITGTRADYGKIKSLIRKVNDSVDLEAYIYVSGMHLLEIFGNTYREVLKDNYNNVYVAYGLVHSQSMSFDLGDLICNLTGYVKNIKPDMIVVHGDRIDALAGATVGALNNIRIAHIEGGELSGTIDESIRHAISKFAHLHFVSNEEAKNRLIQLGEEEKRVFAIGSPDIDIMMSNRLPSLEKAKIRYGLKFEKYGILMYHPVTTEYPLIGDKIKNVVDAVIASRQNYIVVYPNNDLGSEVILNEYKRFEGNEHFAVFPSLRFEHFLTILQYASFIIGNSSAGIREASIYGVPSVDIGSRQSGRYSVDVVHNIQHVNEKSDDIIRAIHRVDEHRIESANFGNGNSTEKFMQELLDNKLWDYPLQKRFVDIERVGKNDRKKICLSVDTSKRWKQGH